MSSEPTQSRHLVTLSLCALLLLCAAVVFSITADTPHVLVLTVAGLVGSLARREPLPRTSRSFVYAGTLVAIVTTLGDMVFTIEPVRFFLLPAELYGPAVIYLGVAATYFDQRETNVAAIIALAVLGTMLGGNCVNSAMRNVRFPFTDGLLRDYHLFFGTMVAIEVLVLVPLLPRVEARWLQRAAGPRFRWFRYVVVGLCLLTSGIAVLGLRQGALIYERFMQRVFMDVFQRYMVRRGSRFIFGQTVDLRRPLPFRSRHDQTVALRVRSELAPGYLRGRVYPRYANGQWFGANYGPELRATQPGGRYAYTVFHRDPAVPTPARSPPDPRLSMEVYPGTEIVGDVLLAPGSAVEFDLIATRVREDANGSLSAVEWESPTGYVLRRTATVFADPYPLPGAAAAQGREYLEVPEEVRAGVSALLEEVFPTGDVLLTVPAKLALLREYFEQGFRYDLQARMAGNQDPIVQFLTRLRRGHCELFAAAAVMLLRIQGIPARYVTGFVCAERHPDQTHWVSRLEDAHAWAEAYVEAEDRWVTVECTPGNGLPESGSRFGPVSAWWDHIALFWQTLIAKMKKGHMAEAIVGLAQGLAWACWWLVRDPLRATLAGLLLLWVLRRWWQRHRARQLAAEAGLTPAKRELRRSLRVVEAHLHRFSLDRPDSMTLRELANLVAGSDRVPQPAVIVELLREYEELRYRQQSPSLDVARAYAQKVRRQLQVRAPRSVAAE